MTATARGQSPIRHALIIPSGRIIQPFGDPVADSQVLGRSLRQVQEEALAELGITLVDKAPDQAPYLLLSDRTWVTGGALRRFLAKASAPARLKVSDPDWLKLTAALQELPEPGLYEVALLPAGAPPSFEGLPSFELDLEFERNRPTVDHPAMAHAVPEVLLTSDAEVHQIDHWTHVLRVNWMAMGATIQREQRKFKSLNILVKIWKILGLLLRVRSINRFRLAAGLNQLGKGCVIHPSAVVEASVIGEGVEIGPFAVVRGAVIGAGVKIEEMAVINASVLGAGAHVGKRGTANLCVLYPGAYLSSANGVQATLMGKDSFIAWGATVFDLSFAGPIKVLRDGQRVSSGTHFLGAVLGHRAKLGAQVTLGYGAEVPNDVLVVGPSRDVLRGVEPGPGPHRVMDGIARTVPGKDSNEGPPGPMPSER